MEKLRLKTCGGHALLHKVKGKLDFFFFMWEGSGQGFRSSAMSVPSLLPLKWFDVVFVPCLGKEQTVLFSQGEAPWSVVLRGWQQVQDRKV